MRHSIYLSSALLLTVPLSAQSDVREVAVRAAPPAKHSVRFAKPVRWTSEGRPIRVDAPGYAAPCWFDVDGDGRKDLVVGQFKGGHMRVYRNTSDDALAKHELGKGTWLEADGEIARVPGVW